MTTNIFKNISNVDSLEQEKLFLIQKYSKFILKKDEISEFFPNLDEDQIKLLDLIKLTNNESLIKKIIFSKFSKEKKFNFNWKELGLNDVKLNSKKIEIAKAIQLDIDLIINDIQKFKKIKWNLNSLSEGKINISWVDKKVWDIVEYYRKIMFSKILLDKKRDRDNITAVSYTHLTLPTTAYV